MATTIFAPPRDPLSSLTTDNNSNDNSSNSNSNGIVTPLRKRMIVRGVRNPGFYDDSNVEYRKISNFECFSGGRLNVSFGLRKGSKLVVTHLNADMDASLPDRIAVDAGVAVGTKADTNQVSAGVTNGWGTLGTITHRFNNKYTLKSDFQFGKADLLNVELLRKGIDCCHSAKYTLNPEGHSFSVSAMQSLTRFLSIGGRLENTPAATMLTFVGRHKHMYKGPEGEKAHHGSATTVSANSEAISVSHTRQLDTHTSLAAELRAIRGTNEISASAAGFLSYQSFELQAKVTPASGLVSCLVEHKYNPSISTLFSGQYNQWAGDSKFGMGLKVAI